MLEQNFVQAGCTPSNMIALNGNGKTDYMHSKLKSFAVHQLTIKEHVYVKVERLRMQRECEEREEQQALHYEDRITELQSVIAELRKKIDLRHINMIL